MNAIKLGVNIDHVATLREARGGAEPDVIEAAYAAMNSGADSITVHLREDRRHIQDKDVYDLRQSHDIILNLEMAATDEMLKIATEVKPDYVCLVPENRQELTTEGGLDIIGNMDRIKFIVDNLKAKNIFVSLFTDPDLAQITAAKEVSANAIEIHTGQYANTNASDIELKKIQESAQFAHDNGLQVNAGHGLTLDNVEKIASIESIVELNIGHTIVSRAVFVGFAQAVRDMKDRMLGAR